MACHLSGDLGLMVWTIADGQAQAISIGTPSDTVKMKI
jgi:hypothetical protein